MASIAALFSMIRLPDAIAREAPLADDLESATTDVQPLFLWGRGIDQGAPTRLRRNQNRIPTDG